MYFVNPLSINPCKYLRVAVVAVPHPPLLSSGERLLLLFERVGGPRVRVGWLLPRGLPHPGRVGTRRAPGTSCRAPQTPPWALWPRNMAGTSQFH